MSQPCIRVQTDDFDQGYEYSRLAKSTEAGAVVTFVGRVRDFALSHSDASADLWIEHYPGMTEKVLKDIIGKAHELWPLCASRVIHRVGRLSPGDQIVFVGVSAAHRRAAFEACAYIVDLLKTQAPFWKKEGDQWVEAKQADRDAAAAWNDAQTI